MPRLSSNAAMFGSRLTLFMFDHEDNAVHMGDPMINNGCSILIFSHACARMTSSSKSQLRPSTSHVVKSKTKTNQYAIRRAHLSHGGDHGRGVDRNENGPKGASSLAPFFPNIPAQRSNNLQYIVIDLVRHLSSVLIPVLHQHLKVDVFSCSRADIHSSVYLVGAICSDIPAQPLHANELCQWVSPW